jgi:transglutaminase/protease-like cytokinesis protein 3
VVAAMVAAQPKEIPMTKAKSKRKPAPRTNDSKTKTRNSVKRTTARKAVQLKSVTEPAAQQRPGTASQPTAGSESKKAHIIAMLRAPGGTTIEAIAHAAKWQPHSVRGFLAGVVRKKLGLNLISVAGDSGRVYRITDRVASAAA